MEIELIKSETVIYLWNIQDRDGYQCNFLSLLYLYFHNTALLFLGINTQIKEEFNLNSGDITSPFLRRVFDRRAVPYCLRSRRAALPPPIENMPTPFFLFFILSPKENDWMMNAARRFASSNYAAASKRWKHIDESADQPATNHRGVLCRQIWDCREALVLNMPQKNLFFACTIFTVYCIWDKMRVLLFVFTVISNKIKDLKH